MKLCTPKPFDFNCVYESQGICYFKGTCSWQVPDKDWLPEQLSTIINLATTALLVYSNDKKLLPTILELLYMEVQQIIDKNCIEKTI